MDCIHPAGKTLVVDELGMMRARPKPTGGTEISAPMLTWHYVCELCGETISTHHAASEQLDPDDAELLRIAVYKIGDAIITARDYLQKGPDD